VGGIESRDRVKDLLQFWLEACRAELGGAQFSAQAFIDAAKSRLAELHPDSDFELGSEDYDHIKCWVFAALAARQLTQSYGDADNRVVVSGAPVQG